jgi:flagellar M-ring protein FliF
VRPLVRRVLSPEQASALRSEALAVAAPSPAPALPASEAPMPIAAPPSQTAKMIDIAQVKGQVHAQAVQKVGELADQNPQETVAIIRHWLHDAA